MKQAMLFYFDLRKYAHIEKSKSEEEVIGHLTLLQSTIEEYMDKINAIAYQIHTDTAIYYITEFANKKIGKTLKDLKNKIDRELMNHGLPSRLHICVIFEEYYSGFINTKRTKYFNLFGKIMNLLEKYIFIVESSSDPAIKEGIVVSKLAFEHIDMSKPERTILQHNEEMYLI